MKLNLPNTNDLYVKEPAVKLSLKIPDETLREVKAY